MFKLVHYEAQTFVAKRTVGIRHKRLLVFQLPYNVRLGREMSVNYGLIRNASISAIIYSQRKHHWYIVFRFISQ